MVGVSPHIGGHSQCDKKNFQGEVAEKTLTTEAIVNNDDDHDGLAGTAEGNRAAL